MLIAFPVVEKPVHNANKEVIIVRIDPEREARLAVEQRGKLPKDQKHVHPYPSHAVRFHPRAPGVL